VDLPVEGGDIFCWGWWLDFGRRMVVSRDDREERVWWLVRDCVGNV